MTIPALTTANTFGEWQNDTQQLIALMNAFTDGPQVNANTLLVLSNLRVANIFFGGGTFGNVNTAIVPESGGANLYFNTTRARNALANANFAGDFLLYDIANGIFSFANSFLLSAFAVANSAAANANSQPVSRNNTFVTARKGLNFISGANLNITIVDDASNNQANITLDGVWGGGPNPLGFSTVRLGGVLVSTNSNSYNLFAGPGVNLTGTWVSGNGGENQVFFYANGPYDQANAAFTAANVASAAAATVQTNLNTNTASSFIRNKFSNTSPIFYDAANGIFSHNVSPVVATTYGDSTHVSQVTIGPHGHISAAANVLIDYTGARAVLSNVSTINYDAANGIISHSTSGVTAKTYGNTTYHVIITTDVQGHLTAASNVAIDYTPARTVLANTAPVNYDSSTGTISHASSGVTANGYGDSISVPALTINASGHVTAAVNTVIRSASTAQTGVVQLNDTVTSSSTTQAATANSVLAANNSIVSLKASLGTMAPQNNNAVDIRGGTIANTAGSFTRVIEEYNVYAPGSGAGQAVDWAKGGSKLTNNGTNLLSFSNIGSGVQGHILTCSNFNNTSFPGSVDFGLGGKPSIAGAAVVSLTTFDGGTTVYASIMWRAV